MKIAAGQPAGSALFILALSQGWTCQRSRRRCCRAAGAGGGGGGERRMHGVWGLGGTQEGWRGRGDSHRGESQGSINTPWCHLLLPQPCPRREVADGGSEVGIRHLLQTKWLSTREGHRLAPSLQG